MTNTMIAEAPIAVPEAARDLLLRIVDGWSPAVLDLGSIKSVRLNSVDFSEVAPHIALVDERSVVTLKGAHVHRRLPELLPFPMDGELEGELEAGGTFRCGDIVRVSLAADLAIETGTWIVELERDEAPLWVGRIDGALSIEYGGNLIVERVRKDGFRFGRACHLRLSGAYTHYLVQSTQRKTPAWYWVVDPGSAILHREALERDFQLLQFVVGCQLRIGMLLGTSRDGRTIAAMTGLGTRNDLDPRSIPPVPINRDNDTCIDESWASLLFDRASAHLSARPESRTAFWMAIDTYLDTMGQRLDADYLRLQVGLEAFAYWMLRLTSQDERMVVTDKVAWKKWVKDNAAAIRALAAKGFEESLLQKVMGVYRLSSGRVVPSAFLAYDLPLTEELAAELERRDVVVHQGLMAPEGYDADRDLRRVAMIRSLLVALMARAVGYSGAINGWELGKLGHAIAPIGWWGVTENEQELARKRYVADDTGMQKGPIPVAE